MCGLTSMMASTIMSYCATYWDPDNAPTYVLIDTFCYTQMVQHTLWVYYYRLKTLPKLNQYDKYVLCIPFMIAVFQIPEAIYYNLDARSPGYDFLYNLFSTMSGLAIILSEFILYFLLVKKLLSFVENNSRIWIVKVTITFIVLLGLDFTEIVLYFINQTLSDVFYSLSFNVRLNAVILFFGDLVAFVKTGQTLNSYQRTPFNSGNNLESGSNIEEENLTKRMSIAHLKKSAQQFFK